MLYLRPWGPESLAARGVTGHVLAPVIGYLPVNFRFDDLYAISPGSRSRLRSPGDSAAVPFRDRTRSSDPPAAQSVPAAAADALGQSIGFGLALVGIAAVRELLGTGMLAGIPVLPESWPAWVIMVLPPGAFLTFGLLLALVNWVTANGAKEESGGN